MAEYEHDGGTATMEKIVLRTPSAWKVLLLNDDETTMHFVIHVLMTIFDKDMAEATHLMIRVHEHGQANVGMFTKEIALTKVKEVLRESSAFGFPLQAVAEAA